jgi:sporulation protein YlmC with PRC-barrel domain
MEIPVGVEVICGTQVCGRSMYLVINPVNDRVTHLVVAKKTFPHTKHLVPVDFIIKSTATSTQLRCSPTELADMDRFMETDFIKPDEVETSLPYKEPVLLWPYGSYRSEQMPLEYEYIPAGEVVIRRGSRVKATDGRIGKVDEFLVNPVNDRISHLIMREGHLWGKKDVTIPVSEIEKIDDNVVYLKLDKQAIAALPATPIHRKWK